MGFFYFGIMSTWRQVAVEQREILSFTCLLHLLYEGEKEEVLKGKKGIFG